MKLFKILFFVVFFTFSVSILVGKENKSTNPTKPMVEELKLPDYDTALDQVDYRSFFREESRLHIGNKGLEQKEGYNIPCKEIHWPWIDDVQRRKKRSDALRKLHQTDVRIRASISDILNINDNNELCAEYLSWSSWQYSDWGDELLENVPTNVNDKLLAETLPYIPDIEAVSLPLTRVTDDGLKNLFYLPLLRKVSIDTPEPEQYPLPITNKGIVLISKLPLLKRLFVRGVRLSDESLKEIAKNGKQIKDFMYNGDGISDVGIAYLKDMPQLESLYFQHFVGSIVKGRSSPKLTARVFIPLSQSQVLKHITFDNYDFIQIPDKETLNAIKNLKKTRIVSVALYHTKVHPLLVKSLCNVQSLQGVDFFDLSSVKVRFNKDNPISYEKIMYRLKQKDQVPQYYLELEKPYFDQFYSRKWNSPDAQLTGIASFIDLKENQVTFRLKGESKEISVPFSKLSKEDQQYVQQIVGK
jgi:hypothetical protein